MGTGNYRHNDGKTVMIDLFDGIEYDDDDPELYQIRAEDARADLHECIMDCLTKSWTFDGKGWRRDDRDCLIIAENAYHQVWTHEDSYGHVFVTFGVCEGVSYEIEGLAQATYEDRSERFFDRLQEHFPKHTYVATSAWTSALREPRQRTGPWSGGGFKRAA